MERLTGASAAGRNSMSGGPGAGAGAYDAGDYRGGRGGGGGAGASPPPAPAPAPYDAGASAAAAGKAAAGGAGANRMVLGSKKSAGGGLALGARGGAASSLAGVIAEEGFRDRGLLAADDDGDGGGGGGPSSAASATAAAAAAAAAAVAHQATVALEERLTVKLTRDGAVELLEVKGSLTLTVADEAAARLKVVLSRGDVAGFQFQTHPHVNKAAFTSDGVIALRAPEKPFPCATPLGMVRWTRKLKDADVSAVPLSLTCWPEAAAGAGGVINVSVEYTLQDEGLTLSDVVISIPLASDAPPKVAACAGEWKHNSRENVLTWHVETISADAPSGALEFSVKARDEGGFFPVSVAFRSSDTLCPISVRDIVALDDDHSLRYGSTQSLEVDSYTVE
jgi:hypothetical protein